MRRKLNIVLFVLALVETALYLNFDKVFVVGSTLDKKIVQGEENTIEANTNALPPETLADPLATTEGEDLHGVNLVVDFEKIDKNTDIDALWKTLVKTIPEPKAQKQVAAYTTSSKNEVVALIDYFSAEYKVEREMMVKIAKCESGFRAEAVNGPYAGVYQFLSSTWISNRKAMGLDPDPALRFNAEESVHTAAFKMSRDGFGAWPSCSR